MTDPAAWTFPERAINFRELYNVPTGDWMMLENVHDAAPPALKTALRQKLHAAIACDGRNECDAALSDVGSGGGGSVGRHAVGEAAAPSREGLIG